MTINTAKLIKVICQINTNIAELDEWTPSPNHNDHRKVVFLVGVTETLDWL